MASTTHNGDFDGLEAADDLCRSLADDAGLHGNYKAWLSDSSGSPSSRFRHSNQPYVLVSGARIADGWDDLTTEKPNGRYVARPLNQTETGAELGAQQVWTNTDADGTQGEADRSCQGWMTNSNSSFGIVGGSGSLSALGAEWTRGTLSVACNALLRFYCFQQE